MGTWYKVKNNGLYAEYYMPYTFRLLVDLTIYLVMLKALMRVSSE